MILESAMKASEIAQTHTAGLSAAVPTGIFGYMLTVYGGLQALLPTAAIILSCVATGLVIAIKIKELKLKSMEVREKQAQELENPKN